MPDEGRATETHASNAIGSIRVIETEPLSIMDKIKEGVSLLSGESGRVTKVTTTHTSTTITTTKMAVGDDHEIYKIMANNGMSATPLLPITLDPNENDENLPPPGGGALWTEGDPTTRKVSFPPDALSSRASTLTANPNVLYSGRILKNGFRLFKKNWHPVDLVIMADGNMEWSNVDAKEHSHAVKLKELQPGMAVLGECCIDIPSYQAPKLKNLDASRLFAVGKRLTTTNKIKSYWFLAESEEESNKLQSALIQILGSESKGFFGPEIRKVWSDDSKKKDHRSKEPSSARGTPVKGSRLEEQSGRSVSPNIARHGPDISPIRNIDQEGGVPLAAPESPMILVESSVEIKQRGDSSVISEELTRSQTTRQVEPPRRKHISAKEAFFAR